MSQDTTTPAVPEDVQLLAPSGGREFQVRVADKTPRELAEVARDSPNGPEKTPAVPKRSETENVAKNTPLAIENPNPPFLSTSLSKGQKKAETLDTPPVVGEKESAKVPTSGSQKTLHEGDAAKSSAIISIPQKESGEGSQSKKVNEENTVKKSDGKNQASPTATKRLGESAETQPRKAIVTGPKDGVQDRNEPGANSVQQTTVPLAETPVPFLLHSIDSEVLNMDAEIGIASKELGSILSPKNAMDTTLDESEPNASPGALKKPEKSPNTRLKSVAAKYALKLKNNNAMSPTKKNNNTSTNPNLPGVPTVKEFRVSQGKSRKLKMGRTEDCIIAEENVKIAPNAGMPVPSIQAYVDNVDQSEETSTQGTQSKQGTQGKLARTEETILEGDGLDFPVEGSSKMNDSGELATLIKGGYTGTEASEITAPSLNFPTPGSTTVPAPNKGGVTGKKSKVRGKMAAKESVKVTYQKLPHQPIKQGPPRKRSVQGIHPQFRNSMMLVNPRVQEESSSELDVDGSDSDDDEPLSKKARHIQAMMAKKAAGRQRSVRDVRSHRRSKRKEPSSSSEYTGTESTAESDVVSTPSDSTATKKRDRATLARMRSEQKLGRGIARKARGSVSLTNVRVSGGHDENNGGNSANAGPAGHYGRIVWAKCAKFPYWPGMVVPHQNYLFLKDPDFDKKAPKDSLCVHFFADGCLATVPTRHIYPYDENRNLQIDEGDYSSQVEQAREAADRVFQLYGHNYPRLRRAGPPKNTTGDAAVPVSLPSSDNDIAKAAAAAAAPHTEETNGEVKHYKNLAKSKQAELKAAEAKIAELQANLAKIKSVFGSIKGGN